MHTRRSGARGQEALGRMWPIACGRDGGARHRRGRVAVDDEAGENKKSTRLANKRTYLAWWRTGLTAFVVSLGTGKLVPALTDETRWPYVVVGVGFALLGIVSWPTLSGASGSSSGRGAQAITCVPMSDCSRH